MFAHILAAEPCGQLEESSREGTSAGKMQKSFKAFSGAMKHRESERLFPHISLPAERCGGLEGSSREMIARRSSERGR